MRGGEDLRQDSLEQRFPILTQINLIRSWLFSFCRLYQPGLLGFSQSVGLFVFDHLFKCVKGLHFGTSIFRLFGLPGDSIRILRSSTAPTTVPDPVPSKKLRH